MELSMEAMYETKIIIFLFSHQDQICLVNFNKWGYWMEYKEWIDTRNRCCIIYSKKNLAILDIRCKTMKSIKSCLGSWESSAHLTRLQSL